MKMPHPISDLQGMIGTKVKLGRNTFTVRKIDLDLNHNRPTPGEENSLLPKSYQRKAHHMRLHLELVSDEVLVAYYDGEQPAWRQEYPGVFREDEGAGDAKQLPRPKITEVRHYSADWKGDEGDE